mmetsp:Transcript_20814/g.30838  ORF Transcript_20814/g.30838 Transcript_20814/m.30838 type:complete len:258 (-) Transcript_20814:54-827(-)
MQICIQRKKYLICLVTFFLPQMFSSSDAPRKNTLSPVVTGSSVLGLKYKDGVMLAADTLASYGSLARYKNVERVKKIGEHSIIGASGEYSDFQTIIEMLEEQSQDDINMDDGFKRSTKEIHSYLRAVMYQKRNKMNPLWNYLLVGGVAKDGTKFLGSVDHIGTAYEDDILATGFGGHLALPMMRKRWRSDMEEGEARALIEDCMRVLFYRDAKSLNRIQIAKATKEGVMVSEPFTLKTSWSYPAYVEADCGIGIIRS